MGWGQGSFSSVIFIFEVPSNLILERIGARLWIARIMLTWGLISAGMAFVTGETSFIVMRFLGVAEARLPSRHDPLSNLLVPGSVSRPRHRRIYAGHSGLDRYWSSDINEHPYPRRFARV
jgi:hypothetical protein